jgi:hypothetical protein
VFEAELLLEITDEKGNPVRFGSIGGGGRYDDLVARFTGERTPATGFSFGVSRLAAALKAAGREAAASTMAEHAAAGALAKAARAALSAAEALVKGESLLQACLTKTVAGALRLIGEGANVDFAANDQCIDYHSVPGFTPLILASMHGLEVVAARLVEAGAKLDLVNERGISALTYAYMYGHASVAQFLAERMDAAALNLVDRDSMTSLDWALKLVDRDSKEGGFNKDKFVPFVAAIRARGGMMAAEIKARA